MKNELFHFDLIGQYARNKRHDNSLQVISDRTVGDLNMEDLFIYMDHTSSRVGQQYLFDRLLTIDTSTDFTEQEQWISYFAQYEDTRLQTQSILSKLNKREAYYLTSLFQEEYLRRPAWFWVIRLMSVVSFVLFIGVFFVSQLFLPLIGILVINMLFHYWNKKNLYMYSSSIPQLLTLCKCVGRILRTDLPQAANRDAVLASLRSIEKLKKRLVLFSLEVKLDSDIAQLLYAITEYIKILFLIEPQVVFNVLEVLDAKREDIHTLFAYVGKIDSTLSITAIRETVPYYCQPEYSTEPAELAFEEAYHPLIPDCIPNSLHINGRSVLLTGSNMAGKSSFIRTIAINCLTAQTLNTCFARRFRLSPMRIFTAIRISDDLLNDKSYYFEEVLTIREMLDESRIDTAANLFLLDELFKGTNTVERIAAGKAVLTYLNRSPQNIVFVSTHDIELADLLRDAYDLYYFTEVIKDEDIHFDYKLKPGHLTTRNAIRILELNGYPEEVIREARQQARNPAHVIRNP